MSKLAAAGKPSDGEDGAGLDKAGLKRMLKLARRAPVRMAFALGADGKALVQMDKRAQPRALERALKEGAEGSKGHRFGMATVGSEDPKLVKFIVNKASSGMARKLVLALKGTGFSKVQIVTEDGAAIEAHEEEDHEYDPTQDAAVAEDEDDQGKAALEGGVADEPPPAGTAVDPGAVVPTDAFPGADPTFGKARMAWIATRKKVETDIGKLHAAMAEAYKGHGIAADITAVFRTKVDPVMDNLDESLAHKLDEVTSNTDADTHAKLVQEARQIIERYRGFVASEPTIAKMDANPFVPLAIGKTLDATLSALSRAIR